MNILNYNGPVNSLSFGNVSYNILRELYKLEIETCFFPIGSNLDFSAFDKADEKFIDWVYKSYQDRFKKLNKENPCLRMWHLNSSETLRSRRQFLYTFYECDEPTDAEKAICKYQDKTIFSSSYSLNSFKKSGCENTSYIPIGFDEDFYPEEDKKLKGKIHFGLIGKFEKRKHTARILKLWTDKYGDNNEYQLTCCINNPFFKPDQMKTAIDQALDGKSFRNVNILPFLKTNSEMNKLYNSIDINLSGLSGAEGWNIPAFNSTCLGKWSIVLNATSHKDWANNENSILIEPSDKEEIYDGIFFNKDKDFNQGNFYNFSDKDFYNACDNAISKYGKENSFGVELINKFSYNNTLTKILETINS